MSRATVTLDYDDLDEDGFPTLKAGSAPEPAHACDVKGALQEIDSGMGVVTSATCSVCGRPAFNVWDIWG